MNTPILDFVTEYKNKNGARFHMPGHKGRGVLGVEEYDITEIGGADALFEASGIIVQSEQNATEIFGTERTLYSTEGSTQCIKAMLYLIKQRVGKGAKILAGRNAHKAFIYGAGLLDLEVKWLMGRNSHSICSLDIDEEDVEGAIKKERPDALYLTSPDYLGNMLDIAKIAEICHRYGVILLVDNAHGAYLKFLDKSLHPMDLGADMCCDSAHKTLPVLTGGAYLHISKNAPSEFSKDGKFALELFSSTSPSYLTLCSLDACNKYLDDDYGAKLNEIVDCIDSTKRKLSENGWQIEKSDPLKIVIRATKNYSSFDIAKLLREHNVECEYCDPHYVVLMLTPSNDAKDLLDLVDVLGKCENSAAVDEVKKNLDFVKTLSIRQALFSKKELVSVEEAEGRICATPCVSCPPAIPIVVSGEVIGRDAIDIFKLYGIEKIEVVKS